MKNPVVERQQDFLFDTSLSAEILYAGRLQ
jgi:hypothetical protein